MVSTATEQDCLCTREWPEPPLMTPAAATPDREWWKVTQIEKGRRCWRHASASRLGRATCTGQRKQPGCSFNSIQPQIRLLIALGLLSALHAPAADTPLQGRQLKARRLSIEHARAGRQWIGRRGRTNAPRPGGAGARGAGQASQGSLLPCRTPAVNAHVRAPSRGSVLAADLRHRRRCRYNTAFECWPPAGWLMRCGTTAAVPASRWHAGSIT